MSVELKASPIIKKHLKTLRLRVNELKEKGVTPQLKVILVGQNPASVIYTENKKKFCEKIGASCEIIKLDETISADDFVKKTAEIAVDKNVHGCLIQLPLPRQLSQLNVGYFTFGHKTSFTLLKRESFLDKKNISISFKYTLA